jgi:hypothetical protein
MEIEAISSFKTNSGPLREMVCCVLCRRNRFLVVFFALPCHRPWRSNNGTRGGVRFTKQPIAGVRR